jgi:hypothetical protein
MENAFTQNYATKYQCISCDFKCSNKYDFSRHLSTRKHKSQSQGNEMEKMENAKNAKKEKFICLCKKEYKSVSGLWKHKQKCNFSNKSIYFSDKQSQDITPQILYDVLNQNKDLQQMLLEQNKTIIEMSKKNQINTIISNNNNNNKTFNLQLFLNEQCKDAMNIMDFIESLKLQIADLENVGKLGFVNGISNIIVKNLKALDVERRPVHCSDSKREIVYVKDENKWEKENENKEKLRNAIKCIAKKNTKLIKAWKDNNPECIYSDSKKSDQYNKIIVEAMGGLEVDISASENKIIKNIAKEVIIDK